MKLKQIVLIIGVLLAVSLSLNAYSLVQIHKWKQPEPAIETLESANLSSLSKELSEAKTQITNHADQISNLVETEKQNKQYMVAEHKIQSSEMTNSINKLISLIYNLPQVSKKLAFANGLTVEDGKSFVSWDFAEWFSGEDAQKAAAEDNQANAASLNNNFYIRNAENEKEKYELTSDTLIFVLDGAQLILADYQQFVQEDITDRLFRLSLVGDKVVLLEEAYRP